MKRKRQDDWETGIGGDPDAPQKLDANIVNRIREDFWRAMDLVPLSVPRWSSVGRTNANIKWLLTNGYDEPVIRASFLMFRGLTDKLDLGPQRACWDAYFSRRASYLESSGHARKAARDDQFMHRVSDRLEAHLPEPVDDIGDNSGDDEKPAGDNVGDNPVYKMKRRRPSI